MRAVIDVWPARKTCPVLYNTVYVCTELYSTYCKILYSCVLYTTSCILLYSFVEHYIVLPVYYCIVVYSSMYYFLYITGGKTCLHSSAACTVHSHRRPGSNRSLMDCSSLFELGQNWLMELGHNRSPMDCSWLLEFGQNWLLELGHNRSVMPSSWLLEFIQNWPVLACWNKATRLRRYQQMWQASIALNLSINKL